MAWHDLNRRWVAQARERGAVTALLLALVFRAFDDAAEGRFTDAETAVAEGRALGTATGDRVQLNALADAELHVLAWRGREAAARPLGAQVLRGCADDGDALTMRAAHGSLAVLELGLGNYQSALCHGLGAFEDEPLATRDSEVDVVEAAVRCGDGEAAAAVLEAFSPRALAIGTDYALGELARCRALLAGTTAPSPSTGWPSSTCSAAGSPRSWPGRGCSTASGCAASAAPGTPGSSCGLPTKRSPRSEPSVRRARAERTSCHRRARPQANPGLP